VNKRRAVIAVEKHVVALKTVLGVRKEGVVNLGKRVVGSRRSLVVERRAVIA